MCKAAYLSKYIALGQYIYMFLPKRFERLLRDDEFLSLESWSTYPVKIE